MDNPLPEPLRLCWGCCSQGWRQQIPQCTFERFLRLCNDLEQKDVISACDVEKSKCRLCLRKEKRGIRGTEKFKDGPELQALGK